MKDEPFELQSLARLVDDFAAEMKKKLFEAYHAGRQDYGWVDPSRKIAMGISLMSNYAQNDMIDVANFAAFIWNINRR